MSSSTIYSFSSSVHLLLLRELSNDFSHLSSVLSISSNFCKSKGSNFPLYMFRLPFSFLTFRSWVLPSLIFSVAFSFSPSSFISAEFSFSNIINCCISDFWDNLFSRLSIVKNMDMTLLR